MASKEEIHATEEHLRNLVGRMPDEKRLELFRQAELKLKDPDTYATLNYLFIAGLHHFYLGKWLRGLFNIAVFSFGLLLLIMGHPLTGGIIMLVISAVELNALFNAQSIVENHNNMMMQQLYNELNSGDGLPPETARRFPR